MTAQRASAPPADAPPDVAGAALLGLLPALRRLDRRLEAAADRAAEARGAHDGTAPSHAPGADDAPDVDGAAEADSASPLTWLADAYGLDAFDVDVLVLALAPELDLRYERLYAYLQDDAGRPRPTVDLALRLLCDDAGGRLARRAHFAAAAPLVRHRLLDLVAPPDAGPAGAPLLAHALAVDQQVVGVLLGEDAIDRRIAHACRVLPDDPDGGALVVGDAAFDALADAAARAAGRGTARVHLHGAAGSGKRRVAAALAARLERPALAVDVARLALSPDLPRLLAVAVREAALRGALAYLHGAEALLGDDAAPHAAGHAALDDALDEVDVVAVVASARPWPPGAGAPAATLTLGVPAYPLRLGLWAEALRGAGLRPPPPAVAALASRFRLTPREIASVVAEAAAAGEGHQGARHAEAEASPGATAGARSLFAAARRQSGGALDALATRITPAHGWDALVLPDDATTQLRELCARVALRERVLDAWGVGGTPSRGVGVTALFSGPSGTGKTMAAEVVAGELGLDLFRVDLARVVSKYIGETEKNLDRVFAAAERANGILLFDEADALFGKRSEVHDAHDRYANLEISYLLQRMEAYDGAALLSTNLRGNVDAAFVRRLTFSVHFPAPDEESRARIWRRVWPAETPVADDVDLDALARRFRLSGGNIRNVALAAAFLAAADGGAVTTAHVLHATRREYQKMGKAISDAELAGAVV